MLRRDKAERKLRTERNMIEKTSETLNRILRMLEERKLPEDLDELIPMGLLIGEILKMALTDPRAKVPSPLVARQLVGTFGILATEIGTQIERKREQATA